MVLAVLIQYRRVTDRQPPNHPASQPRFRSKYRAYVYVVRVKMTAPTVSHLTKAGFQMKPRYLLEAGA